MKVFFHFSVTGFSNTYLIGPEESGDALVIDPGVFDSALLELIETNGYTVRAVLVTHGHETHVRGVRTLRKIYDADVYANAPSVAGTVCVPFAAGVKKRICGFEVEAIGLTGHSSDSLVYKIGDILFTGDSLFAGSVGTTTNGYAKALMIESLREKIMSLDPRSIVLPGHGPPSTLRAELLANPAFKPKP